MNQAWTVKLAGIELPCVFRFPDTHRYFNAAPCQTEAIPAAPVQISDAEWQELLARGMADCAHTEYSMLTPWCCDALLAHDRAIFHGAALRRHDRAWLICGLSGAGKSTQARLLQELRPGEFQVICGDRPVLEYRHSERSEGSASPVPQSLSPWGKLAPQEPDEGSIMVHPSPWNGKENWYGAPAAPLAGVILLERGEENSVEPLRSALASVPMFAYLIQTRREEESILAAAKFVDRLLRLVPVWRMRTHEVPASTELLLKTLFS